MIESSIPFHTECILYMHVVEFILVVRMILPTAPAPMTVLDYVVAFEAYVVLRLIVVAFRLCDLTGLVL